MYFDKFLYLKIIDKKFIIIICIMNIRRQCFSMKMVTWINIPIKRE